MTEFGTAGGGVHLLGGGGRLIGIRLNKLATSIFAVYDERFLGNRKNMMDVYVYRFLGLIWFG